MKPLRVNFDTFSDRHKASSRLRAWLIADQLQAMGHEATVNGSLEVDIQVFQKHRDLKRLQLAREHGARVVYDLDDNYLLEDVGTKDDVIAFMNLADVITVGSRSLHEQASRFHDYVVLFDNPLDILPESVPKADYRWRGHVGWFGAPEGQAVLHTLGLRDHVTTVTTHGDIAWRLETIDHVLTQFDLVVIPVETNTWTLAKNANRLLKCVALGIPFLASRTPEHEHVLAELELPDWLLVEANRGWLERIAEVGRRYSELPSVLRRPRSLVHQLYGIVPSANRWLANVRGDRQRLTPPVPSTAGCAVLAELDVVVLGEVAPSLIGDSVKSLRADEIRYRSLSVISPIPLEQAESIRQLQGGGVFDVHADYFEIYDSLSGVLASRTGTLTLIIQAGIEMARGFLSELESLDPGAIHLFRAQQRGQNVEVEALPPRTLDQLLTFPYRPDALIVSNRNAAEGSVLRAQFGPLALWELLIGMVNQTRLPLNAVSAPLFIAAPELRSRNPMHSYRDHVAVVTPALVKELPSLNNEWDRLLFDLHSAIIENHPKLFDDYQSTIVPRITAELRRSSGQGAGRSRELPRTDQWLAQLHDNDAVEQPGLQQDPKGNVYLIEGRMKRHVKTWLVAVALEQLFGPMQVAEAGLASYEDGPPVDVFADEAGRLHLVAGRQRYQVVGLPVPQAARSEQLNAFPASHETIDLFRGVRWPKTDERGVKLAQPEATASEPTAEDSSTGSEASRPEPSLDPGFTPARRRLPIKKAGDIDQGSDDGLTVVRHQDSWVKPSKLGTSRPYLPTFGRGPFINDTHRAFSTCPTIGPQIDIGIRGSLRREDALKLYEMAYRGTGDVLELGPGHGLATSIMARALLDAGRHGRVVSVDQDRKALTQAKSNLAANGLSTRVKLVGGDALAIGTQLIEKGRTSGLVFVDHSSSYSEILALCRLLPKLVANDGFVLFHDFNDRRCRPGKAKAGTYGVYQAVRDGLSSRQFAFCGVFGSTALYRRVSSKRRH